MSEMLNVQFETATRKTLSRKTKTQYDVTSNLDSQKTSLSTVSVSASQARGFKRKKLREAKEEISNFF